MSNRWLGRPVFDWIAAAVVAVLVWWLGGKDWLSFSTELGMQTRGAIYQTLTGVSGGLLGFFIATVAILLGVDADKPRMKAALADGRRDRVHSFFFAGIRAISMVLVAFVLMLVLDKGRQASKWVEPALVVAVVLASLRTVRIIWILNTVVTIAGRDVAESATLKSS